MARWHFMKRMALAMMALATSGCGWLDLPEVGFGRGPAVGLEDRVWRADGTDGATDMLTVFLSDGTMLTAECGAPWRLASWRRVDDATLVWEAETGLVRAEIAVQGPKDLGLVLDPEGLATPAAYRLALAPLDCARP